MDQDEMNALFDLGSDYFSGYFSDSEITDIDEKYIGSVQDLTALTKVSRQLDHSMGGMADMVNVVAVIMFIILIYLMTKIIIEKNENAISMTKILGYNNREISSLYILPTLFIMILSEIIGCAVGYLAISIFWKVFMNSMGGWFAYYMDFSDFVRMFVMIFIAYIVVMLIDTRRIKKVPMDEALKNVE